MPIIIRSSSNIDRVDFNNLRGVLITSNERIDKEEEEKRKYRVYKGNK